MADTYLGVRSAYIALVKLSWFFHPWVFIVATAWGIITVYSLPFYSKALLQP